jgi:Protein of unknown function (DUF3574)
MTRTATLLFTALGAFALGAGALALYRAAVPAEGVASCRKGAAQMARMELLFGASRHDGSAVGEVEWQAFLDAEVTPRFPKGLTVLTGYGQWQSGDRIGKEGSRLLLIWYAPTADSEARIEAIRNSYKARFGQESVMRVDGLSCVAF